MPLPLPLALALALPLVGRLLQKWRSGALLPYTASKVLLHCKEIFERGTCIFSLNSFLVRDCVLDVFSCSQRLHLQPTATLPSTRLQGGARGLRARSAVGAEAGAFPTTIGDSVRVHSPQGAPRAPPRAHFHPAAPPHILQHGPHRAVRAPMPIWGVSHRTCPMF